MTASERRNAILEDLCMRRYEKVSNLAFQFGVSEKTIRRDILTLSLEYPIYTAQGNGGGIYVDKNFRLGRVYLKNEQQELLERLLPGLDGKDAELMKAILKTFGLEGAKKMTKKAETDYTVKVNGIPNYANIPKAVLEPIAKKFLENILKEQQKKDR